jgi:HSP20 family protein
VYEYTKKIKAMLTFYRDPFKDVLDTFFEKQPLTRENSTKVVTRDNEYLIYLAVPGLTKEDLSISVKDGLLSISYKKEESNEVNYSFVSSFKKTYSIPEDVNEKEITGKVENGVLEILLPKSKKKSLERFISLN